MSYSNDYKLLAEKFNQEQESIVFKSEKLKIYNLPFESFDYNILPGEEEYRCNCHKMKKFREKRLNKLSKQIEVVTLKKDKVIPHYEVVNSLKGEDGKIPIKIKKIYFPYEYNHVIPFPISDKFQKEVNRSFEKVFRYAAKFLK